MTAKQKQIVKERIKEVGYIDRNWCLRNYISRLSAIIYDLKKEGMDFDSKIVRENGGKNYVYIPIIKGQLPLGIVVEK